MSNTVLPSTDSADSAVWYVAEADGHADGPMTLSEIGERLREARYTVSQMAWRQGMNGWSPIDRIPELKVPGGWPPAVFQPVAHAQPWQTGLGRAVRAIDAGHYSPVLLRRVGRIAAALGLLAAIGSVLGWWWGHTYWAQMYLLWVLFALCEGQAGIWSTLAAMPRAAEPSVLNTIKE